MDDLIKDTLIKPSTKDKGVYSKGPFDTGSLSGIATIEDILSFGTKQIENAKHLNEVATFIAAAEQSDNRSIDGLKLAEITYESLMDKINLSKEDCEECGLGTGLETVELTEKIQLAINDCLSKTREKLLGVFTYIDQVKDDMSVKLSSLEEQKHITNETIGKLKPGMYNVPGKEFDIPKDMLFNLASGESVSLKSKICLTGSIYKKVYKEILYPVIDNEVEVIEEIEETLKHNYSEAVKANVIEYNSQESLDENIDVLAILPGGCKLVFLKDKKFLDFRFQDSSFSTERKRLPDLHSQELETIYKSICINYIRLYENLLDKIEDALEITKDSVSTIIAFLDASKYKDHYNTTQVDDILTELSNASIRLQNFCRVFHLYSEIVLKNALASLAILNEYAKNSTNT